MVQPIVLYDHQKPHYERVKGILNGTAFESYTEFSKSGCYFYIDGSVQGNGKTIIVLKYAKEHGYKIMVLCYEIAKEMWRTEAEKYGVEIARDRTGGLALYTYDSIRTMRGKQPKSGLLNRLDHEDRLAPDFIATDDFLQLISGKFILVLDECHKLKNNNTQSLAVKELVYQIRVRNTQSKVAAISGTITDNEIVNFCKVLGVIENAPLRRGKKRDTQLEEEIHSFGQKVNASGHLDFIMGPRPTANYFVEYFNKVIKPKVMSTMEVNHQLQQQAKLVVYNGYFPMSQATKQRYEEAIADLGKAVRYDPEAQTGARSNDNLGAVTGLVRQVQSCKIEIVAQLVKATMSVQYYEKETGTLAWPKIGLYASYFEVIDAWLKELKDYRPLEITGRTARERSSFVKKFQEGNKEHRLLISNPSVGATSISLHDTDPQGRFPRIFFVLKDYNTINGQQLIYRGYRVGTIGTATVVFVYGGTEEDLQPGKKTRETSLDEAINRKCKIISDVHKEQNGVFIHDIPDKVLPLAPLEIEGYGYRPIDDLSTALEGLRL